MNNRISRIWGRVRNVCGITLLILFVIPVPPLLLQSLFVIIGFIVFCILDHIITSECSRSDSDASGDNASVKYDGLPTDAIVEPLGESSSNEALSNVQKYILTTIENNQNLIANFNIPDNYLNGKLVGAYIHKDGFYISEITLKEWLLYVLATNKELKIRWVPDITKLDPVYSNVRDKQGIRFKFSGAESSIILFKEEMEELYPSYVSDAGATIVDLSAHPNLKANTMNALTALTNVSAFTN